MPRSTRPSTASPSIPSKDRARAGCIVTIGDDGNSPFIEGLVDRATAPGAGDADELDAQAGDDGDEPFAPASDDEDGDPRPRPPSAGAEQALRKECGFSQSLVDDLKAHRLQITRAYLAGEFRGRVRSGALCALHGSVRPVSLSLQSARLAGDRGDAAQLAQRSLRHAGGSSDRDARRGARSRLAATAAGRRFRRTRRRCRADDKQRLFAWCIASASSRSSRSRTAPTRCSKRRHSAWQSRSPITGGRPPPMTGAGSRRRTASRSAARSSASAGRAIMPTTRSRRSPPRSRRHSIRRKHRRIGLDRAARDSAAAWLPPGMAYGENRRPIPRTRGHVADRTDAPVTGSEAGEHRHRIGRAASLPHRRPARRRRAQRRRLTRIFGTGTAHRRARGSSPVVRSPTTNQKQGDEP